MPYLLLDDGFMENQKVQGLTDRAFRLHMAALVYCARNLTDGAISELTLLNSAANAKLDRPMRQVNRLVECGLWEVNGNGWKIHDYLEYNPSRAELSRKRQLDRDRKRRQRTKGHAGSHASGHAGSHAHQDPTKGVSIETPPGASPTGTGGKSTIAPGATGTRSTAPPPKETTPEPDVEVAPPPPELLQMFGIAKPNVLPAEPEPDAQDAEAIAYYASLEPGFTE